MELIEREIAYERDPDSILTICPCCGGGVEDASFWRMSCNKCWCSHYSTACSRSLSVDPIAARDWIYGVGVNLRAEGKMPPLAMKSQASAPPPVPVTGTGFHHAPVPTVTPDSITLTQPRLARLLFDSDKTILDALAVADGACGREGAHALNLETMFERAWDRNESGRRAWAESVAADVFARAGKEGK